MGGTIDPLIRPPGIGARALSRVSDNIADVEATRTPVAEHWAELNRQALATSGRTWLALGDSLTQGIGTQTPGDGYVPDIVGRLEARDGEPWRVINLSITGGKLADVTNRQIPLIEELGLEPDLITCIIGSNDIIIPFGSTFARRDAHALVEAIPHGTLLARLGGSPITRRKAGAINEVFEAAETKGRIKMFSPWEWPTWSGSWAKDRFHPNEQGYSFMADCVWSAITESS